MGLESSSTMKGSIKEALLYIQSSTNGWGVLSADAASQILEEFFVLQQTLQGIQDYSHKLEQVVNEILEVLEIPIDVIHRTA